MAKEDREGLRAYLYAFEAHARTLGDFYHADPTHNYGAEDSTFRGVLDEIEAFGVEFPGLAPDFDPLRHRSESRLHGPRLGVLSLLGHVQRIIARLRARLEEEAPSGPATQVREFAFVNDEGLRGILRRDYLEAQAALATRCWKSVLILTGGMLEALLLELLNRDSKRALTAQAAPKGKPDLTRWDLAELIAVATEQRVVGPQVQSVSEAARQYRNLVHPGNELRTGLRYGEEEARILLFD